MLGNDPSQWTTDLYQNEDRETSIKKKTWKVDSRLPLPSSSTHSSEQNSKSQE
jgi:hypothetical protein